MESPPDLTLEIPRSTVISVCRILDLNEVRFPGNGAISVESLISTCPTVKSADPIQITVTGNGDWAVKKIVSFLDKKASEKLEAIERKVAREERELEKLLSGFPYSVRQAISRGIDYDVELWKSDRLFTEENAPHLVDFLRFLPAGKGFQVHRENTGFGYHIHYYRVKKKPERTDVIFTFDPKEGPVVQDTLFWEKHGEGSTRARAKPWDFKDRRRETIHASCCQLLKQVDKSDFKRPAKKARVLFPVQP